jgi:hypothetical protein
MMRFALVREFAFSALAIGAKAGKSMSERTRRYTEGEIGDLRVVEDFLPPPAELVLREDTVKVTLALNREGGEVRAPLDGSSGKTRHLPRT